MGRDRIQVNGLSPGDDDPLSVAVNERARNTIDMGREALKSKRAVLAYQPVMQAGMQGNVAFFEALVRILDVTGRPIPARDFMGEVEDTEEGRIIDCLALELGLNTLAEEPNVRLSVNMSARSIGYTRWMRTLESGLAQDPTIAERLILEIEEKSAMTTPELVISFMRDLQGRGISFALDDFGAGFTSFRHLRDLYFDIVKIDGQFTRNIARDTDNQVVVAAIQAIAREFEMFTVAESVETAKDAGMLTSMGVDCLQGYHFGAPVLRPPWRKSARKTA